MCKQIRIAIFIAITLLARNTLCEHSCIQEEYDFIIVGTGSAGGIILSRLSEDSRVKVLALEAGGEPAPDYDIPLSATFLLRTQMDWNYTTVPQRQCCRMYNNQEVAYGRGKAFGGSSSINFMAVTRGNKNDFDGWQIDGWKYEDVLPFFKKFEDYRVPHTRYDEKYHGKGGPITIEYPEYRTPLAGAYQAAFAELGYKETDYNAEFQTGYMYPPSNTRNHSRCGTYAGYILPAMGRSNLRVEGNALVTQILFDNSSPRKAIGVQYEKEGAICEVNAKKEVIVSGGTINSPQLLMLSGIGPKGHLEKKGIPVVKNVPGVGRNFHDHMDFILSFPIDLAISLNPVRLDADHDAALQYMERRTGPLTIPVANEAIAFVNTEVNPHKDKDWPDLELYMVSDHATRLLQAYLNPELGSVMPPLDKDYFSISAVLHHPKSRGMIQLSTADARDHPIIDPQFLAHPDDVEVFVQAAKIMFQVAETDALRKYGSRIPEVLSPFCDSTSMADQEYLECLVRTWTTTAWHPVGSCKMGNRSDPLAVVDSELRVLGVEGLRVADASIIPTIVTAHTNAVSLMIGEKAAHIIKKKYKLK